VRRLPQIPERMILPPPLKPATRWGTIFPKPTITSASAIRRFIWMSTLEGVGPKAISSASAAESWLRISKRPQMPEGEPGWNGLRSDRREWV